MASASLWPAVDLALSLNGEAVGHVLLGQGVWGQADPGVLGPRDLGMSLVPPSVRFLVTSQGNRWQSGCVAQAGGERGAERT